MINDVINALRESPGVTDVEIQDLIDAAKADLVLCGVNELKIVETDPLVKRAIILYCKANYGYEEPKMAERFLMSYESLRNHLSLSVEHIGGV